MAKTQNAAVPPVENEEQVLDLGIGSEVQSSSIVPFQPTNANPITLGLLTNVKLDTREMKADKSVKDVLVYEFTDREGKRKHFHTEWELTPGEEHFAAKLEGLQARTKHIYEQFGVFPAGGIGKGASTFKQLFTMIADAFNKGGKEGTPIYTGIHIWIKVSYSIKMGAKARLDFPLSPNFVEKYVQNVPTTLYINKKYETIEQPSKPMGGIPQAPGATANAPGSFPDFPA